jgi:hypothetical protein
VTEYRDERTGLAQRVEELRHELGVRDRRIARLKVVARGRSFFQRLRDIALGCGACGIIVYLVAAASSREAPTPQAAPSIVVEPAPMVHATTITPDTTSTSTFHPRMPYWPKFTAWPEETNEHYIWKGIVLEASGAAPVRAGDACNVGVATDKPKARIGEVVEPGLLTWVFVSCNARFLYVAEPDRETQLSLGGSLRRVRGPWMFDLRYSGPWGDEPDGGVEIDTAARRARVEGEGPFGHFSVTLDMRSDGERAGRALPAL